MVTVSASEKGYSMLEMLASLLIISVLMLISLNKTNSINLEHYYFLNNYLLTQSETMLNKKSDSVGHGVYFNSMGRVNQARTIDFDKHKVIIHLGNGYATCE